MAFHSLAVLKIGMELAGEDPTYEDMVVRFFEHFLWIAAAMDRIGEGHGKLWGARLRQYQACVAALIVGCKLRKQTEVSEDASWPGPSATGRC
jgi:hypothetical protein